MLAKVKSVCKGCTQKYQKVYLYGVISLILSLLLFVTSITLSIGIIPFANMFAIIGFVSFFFGFGVKYEKMLAALFKSKTFIILYALYGMLIFSLSNIITMNMISWATDDNPQDYAISQSTVYNISFISLIIVSAIILLIVVIQLIFIKIIIDQYGVINFYNWVVGITNKVFKTSYKKKKPNKAPWYAWLEYGGVLAGAIVIIYVCVGLVSYTQSFIFKNQLKKIIYYSDYHPAGSFSNIPADRRILYHSDGTVTEAYYEGDYIYFRSLKTDSDPQSKK